MTSMSHQISFETYRGSAPENYEKHFVPMIGAPLAADLVEVAALRQGERVLDVACGTGVVARLVAERVGTAGSVAAIDINPGMLAVARAAAPATVAVDWQEANAQRLPFPDESFDVALCSLGLPFFPERAAALREMRRILVPGGRIVFNAPGPAPRLFTVMEEALARHAGADAAAFVRLVFSLHDTGEVERLLDEANFHGVAVATSTRVLRLSAPSDFLWQYVHSTPLAAAAAKLDDEHRAALQREVVEAWRPMTSDGCLLVELGITSAAARK
jgi:ubiquinone/menaquinone biosynthesis C-methylase UbiE